MLALGHGRDKDEPIPKKLEFSKAKIANILVTQVRLDFHLFAVETVLRLIPHCDVYRWQEVDNTVH